jgi:hypothetical protein
MKMTVHQIHSAKAKQLADKNREKKIGKINKHPHQSD